MCTILSNPFIWHPLERKTNILHTHISVLKFLWIFLQNASNIWIFISIEFELWLLNIWLLTWVSTFLNHLLRIIYYSCECDKISALRRRKIYQNVRMSRRNHNRKQPNYECDYHPCSSNRRNPNGNFQIHFGDDVSPVQQKDSLEWNNFDMGVTCVYSTIRTPKSQKPHLVLIINQLKFWYFGGFSVTLKIEWCTPSCTPTGIFRAWLYIKYAECTSTQPGTTYSKQRKSQNIFAGVSEQIIRFS